MRLAGSHSWEVEAPGGNPAAGPCLTSLGLRWARKCEAGGHSQGGCETKLRAVWRRATPGAAWLALALSAAPSLETLTQPCAGETL